MWEAHLGPGRGSFPGPREVCLGVVGREWALALDDVWLSPPCVP